MTIEKFYDEQAKKAGVEPYRLPPWLEE